MREPMAVLARWPLRTLLAGAFIGLCALLLAVVGIAQYVDTRFQLERSAHLELRSEIESGLLRSGLGRPTPPEPHAPPQLRVEAGWSSRAADLASSIGTRTIVAQVATVDGRVLAEAGGVPPFARPAEGPRWHGPDDGPPPGDVPEIDATRLFTDAVPPPPHERRSELPFEGTYFAHTRRPPDAWLVLLVPLCDNKGKMVGVVGAATSWHPFGQVLTSLYRDLLIGFAVLLGLAVVLSRWLAGALARPLERVVRTADRIAEGDLDARNGLPGGRNEIHALAHHIDRMAERVQSTLTAQQRFVEDASHELRTPLTILTGTADALALENTPAYRDRAIGRIVTEVGKMSRLVDDLLLLARAERVGGGDGVSAAEEIDVARLEEDIREYLSLVSGSRTCTVDFAPGLAMRGAYRYLERAVRNLIDNAVKYTADDGHISVRAFSDGPNVRLEVADDGMGIPPKDAPHVFDRFYRADTSRARKSGGSGLGLSIVRNIVAMHGGTCGLDPTVTRGTAVWMSFPSGGTTP